MLSRKMRLPDRQFFRGMFTDYRRLLVFVKPYWKLLAVAGVLLTFNSLLALALPLAACGTNPDESERINDRHVTRAEKLAARKRAGQLSGS